MGRVICFYNRFSAAVPEEAVRGEKESEAAAGIKYSAVLGKTSSNVGIA